MIVQVLNIYDIYQDVLLEAKTKDFRSIIEYAIESNMSIRILYKGAEETTAGWRLIEPYLMGYYNTKTKPLVIRALQRSKTKSLTPNGDGEDFYNTALPDGWRVFRLDRISDVKSGTGKFQPSKRPEYSTNDKGMASKIVWVLKTQKRVGDNYARN